MAFEKLIEEFQQRTADVLAMEAELQTLPGLAGLPVKHNRCDRRPFSRFKVSVKREIVAFGVPGVSGLQGGAADTHVSPQRWRELLEANQKVLAGIISEEHGKVFLDAMGSVQRGIEVVGSARYAEHPSTIVLCLAYDLKDGRGKRQWLPGHPPPAPGAGARRLETIETRQEIPCSTTSSYPPTVPNCLIAPSFMASIWPRHWAPK